MDTVIAFFAARVGWEAYGVAALACVGALAVFVVARRMRQQGRGATGRRAAPAKATSLVCEVCQREMTFAQKDLTPLSSVEIGLVARTHPKMAGKRLLEHACPYCESAHTFVMERGAPQWVGVNLYQPQLKTTRCQECRKILRRPPWPEGTHDGRVHQVPNLDPDLGLICSRCGAVVCVECCRKTTQKRTPDGVFLCPRCMRSPVDRLFHP